MLGRVVGRRGDGGHGRRNACPALSRRRRGGGPGAGGPLSGRSVRPVRAAAGAPPRRGGRDPGGLPAGVSELATLGFVSTAATLGDGHRRQSLPNVDGPSYSSS